MISIILKILKENKDFMKEMGWIVSDASSFEWWGGLKTAHEITISAFLVQMTRWESVVKVINKLREKQLNKIENLSKLSVEDLEKEIRSINFYKTKARRLKAFADKVAEEGGLENFLKIEKRPILLSMEGIGEETADSLLLFAGNNVIFPQSEYLRRVMSRVLGKKLTKSGAKQIVEEKLNKDLFEYKLFHAGIVSIGKAFCYTNNPNCDKCFLKPVCRKYNYETL